MTMVTVTRRRDPLEGERVQVLRRLRRYDRVDLLVLLADGRKRLIPQVWTDAEPAAGTALHEDDEALTLGTVEDLSAAVVLTTAPRCAPAPRRYPRTPGAGWSGPRPMTR